LGHTGVEAQASIQRSVEVSDALRDNDIGIRVGGGDGNKDAKLADLGGTRSGKTIGRGHID